MLKSCAQLEVTVQFDEIDSFQIAHHSRLIVYLERARIQLFASLGFSVQRPQFAAAVYAMKIDFKKPARMLEILHVSSKIERIDGFKIILAERIQRGNSLIMKSKTEIAFLDFDSGYPVPVEAVFPDLQEIICP